MWHLFYLDLIDTFTDFLSVVLSQGRALASIGLLIIEEAGIPLPIPGDIFIAYTGYQVSIGAIPYWVAFGLLLISVMIGSTILYYLSARFGHRLVVKFGAYIHVTEARLKMVEGKFRQFGPWVIIFGRHIPGFRIPITIFSGIAKVSYKTFILSTFISIIFWIPFYLNLGMKLGKKTAQLIHGHHLYFVLVLIPFVIFVLTIWNYRQQSKPKKTT